MEVCYYDSINSTERRPALVGAMSVGWSVGTVCRLASAAAAVRPPPPDFAERKRDMS